MEATKGQKKIMKTEIELLIIDEVKKLREEKNIKRRKLSMELKLTSTYVGRVEDPYNKAKYNLNHLNELARYFDVPFSYFFPETHLEKDCIEEYLDIHPKVKANYEIMAKKYEEEERKKIEKQEEQERKKREKVTTRAKTKTKKE